MRNKHILKNASLLIIIAIIQITLLLTAQTLVAQDSPPLTKYEQITLKKIAREWVKLGEWCISKKRGKEARLCVDKAEAANPSVPKLKTLRKQADGCEDAAKEKDKQAIDAIQDLDLERFFRVLRETRSSMCGYAPVAVLMAAAGELGWKTVDVLEYTSSGDATGDTSQVVAYAAIGFR